MSQAKIRTAVQDQTTLLAESFLDQGPALEAFASQVVATFTQGGRLLVAGHGSLGAIANLVANLFLYRLSLERPSLPALALGNDPGLAACLLRDGQHRVYFSRQLRALAADSDIVLILADNQRDEALLDALAAARQIGCTTALLTPEKAPLASEAVDYRFSLKTTSPTRAVEGTLFFGHLLCELVESELFGI